MKQPTLILLMALLAVPIFIDAYMILEAVRVYSGDTLARVQSDVRLAYNVQFQSIGASVLSLLGLHFCSILAVKTRHPLHVGFIVTTLLTVVILFVARFIAAKYTL